MKSENLILLYKKNLKLESEGVATIDKKFLDYAIINVQIIVMEKGLCSGVHLTQLIIIVIYIRLCQRTKTRFAQV